MIDENAVDLALTFLDRYKALGKEADLVTMLAFVDCNDKIVLNTDELNEVLNRRPDLHFQRINGRVVFNWTAGER